MEKRPARRTVNQISNLQREETSLDMITPSTDVTELPYQGFINNQQYYSRMQASCFELDNAINEIVSKKFTGNNLRNMTDEDAINAYKAMEQAKANRAKLFIDLANHMSNDEFFKKQQEIDRIKAYKEGKFIDAKVVSDDIVSDENPNLVETEETKQISELERNKQQQVIRLLQEAVMNKLERQDEQQ